MLSPEEDFENKARSGDDSDSDYSSYLKSAKYLHRFQLLVLAISGIQLFTFFSLSFGWYSDFIYNRIVTISLEWEIPYVLIILYVKIVQLVQVMITYRILIRLKHVLFNEPVDLKEIDKLHIIQLLLLIAIPNLLSISFFLVILIMRISMKLRYKAT